MGGQEIDWVRWFFYFLTAIPFIAWLFFTRNRVLRVLGVIAVLIFLQGTLAGRRYIWAFSIAPSFLVTYTALLAGILEQRRLPSLGTFGPLWIAFLFFAFVSLISGSLGTGLLPLNVKHYQIVYLEGFGFFVLGLIALRHDEELLRFFRLFPYIGAGVALVHFFARATGFTFRNAIETGISYGVMFENVNSLGSFYVLVLPASVFLLMRGSQPGWMRWPLIGSMVLMSGSLLLTGSRGGLLFTALMCGYALIRAGVNATRVVAAGFIGSFVVGLGYLLLKSLLSTQFGEVVDALEEEGLQTSRFQLWAAYFKMALMHPFGVGLAPANFLQAIGVYKINAVNAHNIYLDMAVQTGIMGLVIWSIMVATVLLRNRRAFARTRDKQAREALDYPYLVLIGYLAVGVVEPIFVVGWKLNNLFWLFCGLSLATAARVTSTALAGEQAGEQSEGEPGSEGLGVGAQAWRA